MQFFKTFLFILFSYFISKVFSLEVLKKYSSIKPLNNYVVFDSSEFKIGDKIYFQIKASSDVCSKNLYYEFYDDVDSIDYSTPYNHVSSDSSSSTSVNGQITSYKLYFTIKKEEKDLNGKSGNYLYMTFDCSGSIEFENTKISGATSDLIIVFVILGVVFAIIIAVFIYCCYCRRRARIKEINRMNMAAANNVYPIEPYSIQGQPMNQVQYGNSAYSYQTPYGVYINPNTVNIAPNVQVMPQSADKSSNREIYSQNFEKPKE